MTQSRLRIRFFSAAILLAVVLSFVLSSAAYAAEMLWDGYDTPSTRQKERLLDTADLLTDDEEEIILDGLNEVSENRRFNVAILTVDDYTGPIQDFADDYFEYNGFRSDFDGRGILFMLSMNTREWAFSIPEEGTYAFTDYGQNYMINRMIDYLRDDNYYGAFMEYISLCDSLIEQADEGHPLDVGIKPPKTGADRLKDVLISLVIGLISATIPIFVMKNNLRTVRMNTSAANYQSSRGVQFNIRTDRFIRKAVTRTARPKDTGGSRSSGGGGTTLHRSSSGHSYGGSHGRF
ncbi:MAG: TPM domain-containing protein [Butyrivibrio sp.]|nr:TPM domain-containing protein [Butyrivibrio sp.]